MNRQEKYKETQTFHFHNQNPKGRYTTDCVIRAISHATGIPYSEVVMDLARLQCETGLDDGEKRLYGKYLKSKGWVMHRQPKRPDGTKFTGKDFCAEVTARVKKSYGGIIANIGGHHIAAIMPVSREGYKTRFKVCDTWNSTSGCIGNYWTKHAQDVL